MSRYDFSPTLAKIERAETKLKLIHTQVDTYFANETPVARKESVSGRVNLVVTFHNPVPTELAFELVEAVGQLRSALDKLAVALVVSNGRSSSGVHFPFGGNSKTGQSQTFPSAKIEKELKPKLTTDQYQTIIGFQQHRDGDQRLWAINEIANYDKHGEALLETYPDIILDTVVNVTPYHAIGSDPLLLNPQRVSKILADGSCEKIVFSYLKSQKEPVFDFGFRMGIVFQSSLSVRGMEIRSTLRAQIGIVKRIVAAFQI